MQLQLATLCDSAADYQGKLCIMGTFDTLCASQFPVTHPQCALAVRLLCEPHDVGRHEFNIMLLDEADTLIIPAFNPVIEVAFPPGAVPFVTRNLVLNLQRLRFEKPGVYRFSMSLDNKPVISLPLRVTDYEEMHVTAGPAG